MQLNRSRLYVLMPISELIKYLDEFLALSLNCEIFIDSETIDRCPVKEIELINSGFEKHGLSKRVHGPFSDLNPGSSDRKIRQITQERFLGALGLCRRLKADGITLHSHFEPIFYGRHFEEWFDNSKQVWERLIPEAIKDGISINIENSIDNSTRAVVEMLKAHPYLGACLDVAHYNVFHPRGWRDAIREYPLGSIKEVHLSDNKGDEDSHLALGKGLINFEELFVEIKGRREKPLFTIEPHSPDDLAESLRYIKRYMDTENRGQEI